MKTFVKKLIAALVDVITVVALLLAIVGGAYLALPAEFQELIPLEVREVLVLIVANGTFGTILAVSKTLIKKATDSADVKINVLMDLIAKVSDENRETKQALVEHQKLVSEVVKRSNELIETELAVKRTNPVLTDELKDRIDKLGV